MNLLIKKNLFLRPHLKIHKLRVLGLCLFLFLSILSEAFAWPTDGQWIPLPRGGAPITDDEGDTQGSRNVVPDDGTFPAAYIYNDGSYLYYRMRLDEDPTASGAGQGILQSFGWGFEIDIDQNAYDYEWLIMCDGIESPETVSLQLNTDKTHVGDPSDKAEYIAAEYPLIGNHRILMADTCTNDSTPGDGCGTSSKDSRDYFLDFRLPYAIFKAVTGITDNTLVRYFVGSSSSSWTLVEQGADLVVGSGAVKDHELLSELSDYVTPFGTISPTISFYDADVSFVDSLDGFTGVTASAPGDRIFIKVYDRDLSLSSNPGGTVLVTVATPGGDIETVILSATGISGKYTGYIDSLSVAAVNVGSDIYATNDDVLDGTLQLIEGESITVEYLDIIAANRDQQVPRTDTLSITSTGVDISVDKSVDINIPNEGATVNFTVTVTNHGPSNATGLAITDAQPSGLTFATSAPSQGTYTSGVWNIGDLADGASATLSIQATVNGGTNGSSVTNTAFVSALDQTDGNSTNDSADATINVGGTDLRVTKTVSTPYPNENGTLSYTIQVVNLGPSNTSGVQVKDLLDNGGLTYNSDAASQGSYNSGTGDWTIGSLNVGQAETLTINATVKPGTLGSTISNTAELTASIQPDSNSANDIASADIQVGFLDLELTKTVDNAIPSAKDPIVYTLTLTNHGPNTATGIQVFDALPIGVTYSGHSAPAGTTYTSGSGIWNIGNITSGTTLILTINADVNNNTEGQTINNTAQIYPSYAYDYDAGNDFAFAPINVDGTDLQVVKTAVPSTPNIGDTVTWTVTVTNNGPNPASSIEITDILPDGISHVSDSTTISHGGAAGSWDGGNNNSTGVWDGFDLPTVNDYATLTIVTTVDNDQAGNNISNVAFITMDSLADPNEGNNVDDATISVGGTDLAIAKNVDISNPDVGDSVVYTLVVTNEGPNTANNIQVTDQLPPEVSYISDDSDGTTNGTYSGSTGIWDIGQLANGASVTLNITATVLNEDQHLVITNTARISQVTEPDPDSSNNIDTADINVSAADLAVSKTISNLAGPPYEAYAGQQVVYTITATNNDASNQVTNVEIEDVLPAGVTYVSSTTSQGFYSTGGNLWLAGTIATGDSATLDLTVSLNAPTAGIPLGSIISNLASLSTLDQIDTDNTNDSARVDFMTIDPPSLPLITFLKSSQVLLDPINGATSPQPIPGAEVLYSLQVTNFGGGPPDNNSMVFTDPIPIGTSLFTGDLGQGEPVLFEDTDNNSGFLAPPPLPFIVTYSVDGNTYFDATGLTPDVNNFDPAVRYIKIEMIGTMAGDTDLTDTGGPDFSLQFKTRIE